MNDDDLSLALGRLVADRKRVAAPSTLHERVWAIPTTAPTERSWLPRIDRGGFTMFSALKSVVAVVIVALFGGFLLTGGLTTPQVEEMVPATVTESPSPTTTEPAGVFSPAGSLSEARRHHTATLLPDGRVLVIGGHEPSDPNLTVASAEVWDPVTGSFGPAGSLAIARDGHTATLLPDGRVVVIGGSPWSTPYHPLAIEVWDPATGSFSPMGSLAGERWGHTATLLPDGRVLVVGGSAGDAMPVAEAWDPATASFAPAGSLTEARSFHTATLLPDGRVLVIGAMDSAFRASAEVWDPATESFSPAGSMNEARAMHTATLLSDGRVLVVGGGDSGASATAEVWDPETGSFDFAGSLAHGRGQHTATLLSDGRVLVAGGSDGLAPAEVWDPATASFGPAGSLAEGRWAHTATLLPDGRVLLVGGGGAAVLGGSAEYWTPGTGARDEQVSATPPSPAPAPGAEPPGDPETGSITLEVKDLAGIGGLELVARAWGPESPL